MPISKAISTCGVKLHPNKLSAQIRHLPVLTQFRGALCGFHMYYNVKCLIKALLAKTKYEQLLHVLDLESARNFWLHHKHCVDLLQNCTNTHYVSKADKASLLKQGPLDRSNLTYLMQVDP